jgi:uncharacterized protein with NRDE domain
MCTLIVLNECHPKFPLIIAANRDEVYGRPSSPASIVAVAPHTIISPKDMHAGGTWIGASSGDWFVALTNQDDNVVKQNVDVPFSRGQVVADCLTLNDHRLATKRLLEVDMSRCKPFNIVFGRPGVLFLSRMHRDRAVDLEIVPQGITVVTGDCAGNKYQRKANHCTALASCVEDVDDANVIVTKLAHVLSDHAHYGLNDNQAICVHSLDFGTRSSTIILYGSNGAIDYYHSEGNPCDHWHPQHFNILSMSFNDLEKHQ